MSRSRACWEGCCELHRPAAKEVSLQNSWDVALLPFYMLVILGTNFFFFTVINTLDWKGVYLPHIFHNLQGFKQNFANGDLITNQWCLRWKDRTSLGATIFTVQIYDIENIFRLNWSMQTSVENPFGYFRFCFVLECYSHHHAPILTFVV